MPKVSDRSSKIIHSPIRSLIPHARDAKNRGVKVHHLNIGQPDIQTPVHALTALRNYSEDIIRYGASEGSDALRKTVCKYYNDSVAPIDYEDIYVTTGASEGILFALFSCFDPGAEIIIPEPFYANYIGFSQVSGVQLVPVTSRIEDEFALPSTEDFVAKITNRTKAVFLCNPGNPSGNLYSRKDLEAIADLIRDHDLFLIVDEVYREFCYDDTFYSVLNLDGLEENILVIDSVSKVFSACGSRVGFVVSRNRSLMTNILKYAQLRLCPPMLGQYVANACFTDRKSYLDKVREEYNKRRLYLYDRLSRMEGVQCYLPKAAFYIMTGLPVDDAENFCKWLLTDFASAGSTVMMAPGHGFYLTNGMGTNQVRIAFVLGGQALEESMDLLEEALHVYQEVKQVSVAAVDG